MWNTAAARDIASSKRHPDPTFLLSQLTPFRLICSGPIERAIMQVCYEFSHCRGEATKLYRCIDEFASTMCQAFTTVGNGEDGIDEAL